MGDCLIVRRGGGVNVNFPVSIAVTTAPTKTSYKAGETINLSGMVVMATYADGSMVDVTSYCTFSPDAGEVVYEDTTKITASWTSQGAKGLVTYTCEQAITVTRVLKSIAVTTMPSTTQYTQGDALSLAGMVITATFTSGKTAVVTGYTTTPKAGSALASGTQTITVSYAENSVTATTSFTVEVKATTVPWSTGSDAEIAAMIQAADNGEIDLHDYWAVGDTRTVSLSAMSATNVGESHAAQTVQLVLMDSTCTGFTFTSGGGTPRFIVGMYNCLNETGYMNSSNTNVGGWSSSARRKWCNNEFYNSIPSTLRSIFKQFTWKQGQGGYNTSGLTTTQDYFGLPPEKAVFGSNSYSYSDEAALYANWSWYTDSSHRIKTVNGSAYDWWECSPRAYTYNSDAFCYVYSDGFADISSASISRGLAPFGCI